MARLSADEAALLKAVCRNRDDDLPRLVYADWLEENGRPERAEFIRLQIEADRDTTQGLGGRWQRELRITTLRRDHAVGWLRELPKWALNLYDLASGHLPEFRRGFVSEFELVAAPFLRYGPQLLDRTPIDRLKLTELRKLTDDLVRCVWLREVPRLDLRGAYLGNWGVTDLADAEWLVGTQDLDLGWCDIGDLGCRALARCRHLRGLRRLGLRGNDLTLAGVRWLADSPYLTALERFELSGNLRLDHHADVVDRLLGGRVLWH